ncbi:MAG: hypothetical protein ABI840_09580 [bacterium]
MSKTKIPIEIQEESKKIISDYNQKKFKGKSDVGYIAEFKGDYLYLNRTEYNKINPVVRLKYSGNMKNWKFEIFKWSSETFDSEDLFFPGCEFIDGTIQGAMKAGDKAYPV